MTKKKFIQKKKKNNPVFLYDLIGGYTAESKELNRRSRRAARRINKSIRDAEKTEPESTDSEDNKETLVGKLRSYFLSWID